MALVEKFQGDICIEKIIGTDLIFGLVIYITLYVLGMSCKGVIVHIKV